MSAGLDGELELGANAVSRSDQQRILEAAWLEVEQAAEPANAAQKSRAGRLGGKRAYRLDQGVARIDVDAGVAVGEGSLVLGFRGHPGDFRARCGVSSS